MQVVEIKHRLQAKNEDRQGRTTEEADRTAQIELITKQKSDYARSVERTSYMDVRSISVKLSIKGEK